MFCVFLLPFEYTVLVGLNKDLSMDGILLQYIYIYCTVSYIFNFGFVTYIFQQIQQFVDKVL